MFSGLKKRIRERKGVTLGETLMVVLILSLVTAIVAEGIPLAKNAYAKVVDSANAEVILSTALTELRYQLGTASGIEPDASGNSITFTTRNGYRSRISNGNKGIMLTEYIDIAGDNRYEHSLVFDKTAGDLIVSYGNVSCAGGVITFTDIKVMKGSAVLSEMPTYLIRVLSGAA